MHKATTGSCRLWLWLFTVQRGNSPLSLLELPAPGFVAILYPSNGERYETALENLDYEPQKIQQVVCEMRELFDWISTDQADKHYCNSPY